MLPSSVFSRREWSGEENTRAFQGDPDGVNEAQSQAGPSAGKCILNVIPTSRKQSLLSLRASAFETVHIVERNQPGSMAEASGGCMAGEQEAQAAGPPPLLAPHRAPPGGYEVCSCSDKP